MRELVNVVERALSTPAVQPTAAEDEEVEEQLPLIGRSQAMQEIYRVLARLMGSDLTVMIAGESGTGKSWSPARCMITASGGTGISLRSTWRRFRAS